MLSDNNVLTINPQTGFGSFPGPRPRIAEPERRQNYSRSRFRSAIDQC